MNSLAKPEKAMIGITVIIMFAGALTGALYMAYSNADNELYTYLSQFFESFSADANRFTIFKNSLGDNLKIVLLLALCGFFKFGVVGSLGCCAVKGFINGFTTAAFVRYYGIKGLLVPLSSLLSTVMFIPVFILFCAFSACFSLKKDKRNKNSIGFFLIFSLLCLTVFCLVSVFDGYVTTTFMKLAKPFIIKI